MFMHPGTGRERPILPPWVRLRRGSFMLPERLCASSRDVMVDGSGVRSYHWLSLTKSLR
jgi:hypothetical protein